MQHEINLNADMGESFGKYTIGNDAELMKVIRSANIACGFHAGDATVMTKTVRLALECGASIGAHPGFNDLWGFGRRQIAMNAQDLEYMITYQIGALQAIAAAQGTRVTHVKPHGALNNMAHHDFEIANAIARGIRAADRELIFVANACSEMVRAGHANELKVAEEAYVDRTYTDSGLMTPRTEANAVIKDAQVAARQVLSFIEEQAIVTASGKRLPSAIRSFCTHGDEPTAVALATLVRAELERQGVRVVPLTEMSF
ncbi:MULTISPECIES: LamB/YcsF family protein [unclassified Cupriavidus]|uniref:LamB/YcsF family protein n=1 Tax=unclassified Cupriavidus TaxID=2640874 RepID=UPI00313D9335